MKKFLCLFLAFLFAYFWLPNALATGSEAEDAANKLYELGLFYGTGTDEAGNPTFDLERAPTREEAVTMLVRLLGCEEEALAGTGVVPFIDISEWAKPYICYAYEVGLAAGTGPETFDGKTPVTAAAYVTFVLRALGYSSAEDFRWDDPWELSNQIGLTDGRYSAETNFLRGDTAIVSLAALGVELKGGGMVLRDVIFRPEQPGPFDRVLTNTQIAALAGKDPAELREAISTVADARAYLNQQYPQIYRMAMDSVSNHPKNPYYFPSAKDILNGLHEPGQNSISAVLTYLLNDDFDITSVYGLIHEQGTEFWALAANCVKTDTGYYFFNSALGTNSTGLQLPETETASLEEYGAIVTANLSLDKVQAIYLVPGGQAVSCIDKDGWVVMECPLIQPFYTSEAWQSAQDSVGRHLKDVVEQWSTQATGLKISSYGIPKPIGNTTLSYQDASNLVGEEPEIIAERVKTVGDVLQYMIAARFGYNAPQVYTPWYKGWGFDPTGDIQLKQNYGCCCGGYANTVSYLLQGDYEKIGELRWIGGGNHVINWVYTEGKYYVFDFTQYCSGGNYTNFHAPVTVLDRLEDYYDHMPNIYPKAEVAVLVAFETAEAGYPSRWTEPPNQVTLTFPSEAEGKVLVIYQGKGNHVTFEKIQSDIPGWIN